MSRVQGVDQNRVQLRIQALDDIVTHCSKYYGLSATSKAVQNLKQWYLDQEFDDVDFTDDWIPGDFDNCDGIDVFVKELNHPSLLHNQQNKRTLFDWICYWLLPFISEPPAHQRMLCPSKQYRSMTLV